MKLTIPYLEKEFPLDIPDANLLCVAEPNDTGNNVTEDETITIGKALGADSKIGEFLKDAHDALVIVNDATRPTPTAAMLKSLSPYFEAAGLGPDRITILVATGGHRAPTDEEYRTFLGDMHDLYRRSCVAHDSRKEEDLTALGVTKLGTPVVLNKRILNADRIVVTGSVEPHYFAGFTGGPKAFFPGLAAFKSIETNHCRALNPDAKALALKGNPVREDIDESVKFIKAPIFSIMTVLDKDQKTAAAFCGDILGSFNDAVELSKKIFCVSIKEKADIVISVAKYPMDINLYQSQKAIDNGALALKDGGTLILVASCRDGLGDKTFAALLASAKSPADALEKIRLEYKLGYHKAAKMALVSGRATVTAVAELPAAELNPLFIEKAASPQDALEEAFNKAKKQGITLPKVLVLPDGCVTVPVS